MGKGYAEGSAVEERLAALERGDDLLAQLDAGRAAVYGSTEAEPGSTSSAGSTTSTDALFASGEAWAYRSCAAASSAGLLHADEVEVLVDVHRHR